MTKLGCSGYCLSHQLLYFLSARMVSASVGPAMTCRGEKGTHGSVVFYATHREISKVLDLGFGHQEKVRVACHPLAVKS